jgi:RNA polymerase sigma factor (sigma-70 family)
MTPLPLKDDSTKDLPSAMAADTHEPRPEEQALLQVLARLPQRCRDVIVWYHRDQQTYEEIAARLDLSSEAARQLHREAIAQAARELYHPREL